VATANMPDSVPVVPSSSEDRAPRAGLAPSELGPRADRERFRFRSSAGLVAPAFVLIAGLLLFPVGFSIYLGLTNISLVGPTANNWQFTGLANLSRLIHDSTFISSLGTTAIFVVGSVAGSLVLGLMLAMALRRSGRLVRAVVTGVVIVAWMMPSVSTAMTWYASTTAQGTFGKIFGVPGADILHANPLLIVTLANIWQWTGFAMLVLAAALRNIPADVIEAAEIEKASWMQRFRLLVLPLLRPTIIVTGLLVFLLSLGNFSLIYIMTQGGPGNATNILPVYTYEQAFQFNNLGYGALIGDVMVIASFIVGIVYVRVLRVRS
jgi:multiple sugar transport system permease protein